MRYRKLLNTEHCTGELSLKVSDNIGKQHDRKQLLLSAMSTTRYLST